MKREALRRTLKTCTKGWVIWHLIGCTIITVIISYNIEGSIIASILGYIIGVISMKSITFFLYYLEVKREYIYFADLVRKNIFSEDDEETY